MVGMEFSHACLEYDIVMAWHIITIAVVFPAPRCPTGLYSPHSLNLLSVVLVIRAHFDGNEAEPPRCAG